MTFPTPEQEKVLAATCQNLFVQACPGAGKTRVIAERFHRHIAEIPSCRGIALLSFTNAAADEIRTACTGESVMVTIGYPSFIGTIDSFIAQFLVLPFESSVMGGRLQLVDSWDSWGFGQIRLRGGKSKWGLSLDWLAYVNGEPVIDLERINRPAAREEVENNVEAYQAMATQRLKGLNRSGYISCSDARHLAIERIHDPRQAKILGRALAARFVEILWDEAQDCNDEDLQVMEWLVRSGIPTVVGCDPDQAIFEFRTQCSPTRLQQAVSTHKALQLTGNFRSSPAICKVAATLRATRSKPDNPLGPYGHDETPIHILPYQGRPTSDIGRVLMAELQEHACPKEGCRVLAHKARVAAESVGVAQSQHVSSSTSYQLALAVTEYRAQGTTGTEKLHALRQAERVILQRLMKKNDVAGKDPERLARRHGIPDQWLRLTANSLLCRLPLPHEYNASQSWVAAARGLLCHVEEPPDICWKYSAKEVLRGIERYVASTDSPLGLPYSTIHKAKGQQFDAVMFVIPPDSISPSHQFLVDWQQRNLQEPNRVAYVAVTRAKRLLVIAIPSGLSGLLISILETEEVPLEKLSVESLTEAETRQLSFWEDS